MSNLKMQVLRKKTICKLKSPNMMNHKNKKTSNKLVKSESSKIKTPTNNDQYINTFPPIFIKIT